MRRLQNHMIGVDQGSTLLFSDFENNGPMWTGFGARESRTKVVFTEKFNGAPVVHLSLEMWDTDQKTNQRADLSTANIDENGFEIVIKTWGDTKIARMRAAWLAIGEVKSEDDWELY